MVAGAQILPFTEAHAQAATHAFLRFGKGRHAAGPLLFTGGDFGRTDVVPAVRS